jgi:hypothetical protein
VCGSLQLSPIARAGIIPAARRAMLYARIHPEPSKGGRGKKSDFAAKDFGDGAAAKARAVMRDMPMAADQVIRGEAKLDVAYQQVLEMRRQSNTAEARIGRLANVRGGPPQRHRIDAPHRSGRCARRSTDHVPPGPDRSDNFVGTIPAAPPPRRAATPNPAGINGTEVASRGGTRHEAPRSEYAETLDLSHPVNRHRPCQPAGSLA